MIPKYSKPKHCTHKCLAWTVHLFTGSGAFLGMLALREIVYAQYIIALWLMGITVLIDAVDGTFARLANVKTVLPQLDGTLLDNIVDYLNYVIVPCFFLIMQPQMLPNAVKIWIIFAISLASLYQFCQADAKTQDHFFKGFPSYWNFAVFYMFIFHTKDIANAIVLIILCIMVFVPIKYVYPSRLDFLTPSRPLKKLMHGCSLMFGISSGFILWEYPNVQSIWLIISLAYGALYLFLSFYRTIYPMPQKPELLSENS